MLASSEPNLLVPVGLHAWACCVHALAQMGHHKLSERVANSLMATE
jgi:hypothetical protein